MAEQIIAIDVSHIRSSPYQHRRIFDTESLRELAKSIQEDGLLQPITVRKVSDVGGSYYELIAGERRWRAVKEYTNMPTINAIVLQVNDLQARRLCATENLQRADLTSLEEVMALTDLVDATLILEYDKEYTELSSVQEPRWRVRKLLHGLIADTAHRTDYFVSKFTNKVKPIFANLPKPKDWISFATNDMPLIFTSDEVQQFSLEHKLNKSQTKAFNIMQKESPGLFKEIVADSKEIVIEKIIELSGIFIDPADPDPIKDVRDLSAETIRRSIKNHSAQLAASFDETFDRTFKPHVAHNSGDNEWYTPETYIEAARSVMGKIDIDPASNDEANRVVRAETIYTADDNGLKQKWVGKLWMNPPYSSNLIDEFIEKLYASVMSGDVTDAIVLVNNATETRWFSRLARISSAICFPIGRVKFWHPHKKDASPLQGQSVVYIGKDKARFIKYFWEFGTVVEIVK